MPLIVRGSGFSVGGGNKGYVTNPVTIISGAGSEGTVRLQWKDPEDTVLDSIVFAKWAGTIIVRKEGEAPQNEKDGTVVGNNTVRNQYEETPFLDNGVENGKTYYYALYPYSTEGNYNYDVSNIIKITVRLYDPVFGNNSWEAINDALQNNAKPDTWNIGDEKEVVMAGSINKTVKFKIIGFENDYLQDGITKTKMTMMTSCLYDSYKANKHGTGASPHEQAEKNTGLFSKYYESFPEELKNVIKPVRKFGYTGTITPGNTGNGYSGKEFTCDCTVFVPTARDLNFGILYDLAFDGEYIEKCKPYPVFTDYESRIFRDQLGAARYAALLDYAHEDPSGTGGGTWEYNSMYVREDGNLSLSNNSITVYCPMCFCL